LVASPQAPRPVPAPFVIGDVTAVKGGRYRVSFADPTTLLIARAPVMAVHPAENAISIDAGTITRQAKRFLDGKRARARDKLLLVTGFDGTKVQFAEKGAAGAFHAGDVVEFYDLGPGDRVEIGTIEEERWERESQR
jgi:hypothetical protein